MILLMGIAGSGKGTQGKLLAERDGFTVISTGELLRVYGSADQHKRMLKGEILGDAEVTELLDTALTGITDQNNVILDGYPRRISQAEWLLEQQAAGRFHISCVVHLLATRKAVKARLHNRGRQDDHDASIEQRFDEYEQATVPILDHFIEEGVNVCEVNAEQSVDAVHDEMVRILNESLN